MQRHNQQSVVISVLIHAGFVGMAVLILFLERWLEEPEPVVFELVASASAPPQPERNEPMEEEVPLEPLEVPEIPEPIEPLPDVPDLPEPEPPPPEPEPVKQLSYEEFIRNRKMPERVQRVETKRKTPIKTPELETNIRDRLEKTISEIAIQGADIGQIESNDELLRYLSALRSRIESAFEPRGAQLEAEVYFTISAGGRILNATIHRSSGDTAFDQSVLRTMRATTTPGPPPGNRDYSFSLVFRSQ